MGAGILGIEMMDADAALESDAGVALTNIATILFAVLVLYLAIRILQKVMVITGKILSVLFFVFNVILTRFIPYRFFIEIDQFYDNVYEWTNVHIVKKLRAFDRRFQKKIPLAGKFNLRYIISGLASSSAGMKPGFGSWEYDMKQLDDIIYINDVESRERGEW